MNLICAAFIVVVLIGGWIFDEVERRQRERDAEFPDE